MGKHSDKKSKKKSSKKDKISKTKDVSESVEKAEPVRETYQMVVFAHPLGDDELKSRCLKLVQKAAKSKELRRGVKEVLKAIRKGARGVVFLAGNVSPPDVIVHIPVYCETKEIPYVFLNSKEDMGAACGTKRPSSCLMIVPKEDETTKAMKRIVSKIEKLGNNK